MEEVFKEIPDYPDYKVSNLGRVKSFKRNKEIFLKPINDTYNYLQVVLYKNKKPRTIQVHRLVAMVFLNHIFNTSNGIVVDHINNNRQDNRLENLQLITIRQNNSKDRVGGASNFIGVYWNGKIFERIRAECRQNGEEDLKVISEITELMEKYKASN